MRQVISRNARCGIGGKKARSRCLIGLDARIFILIGELSFGACYLGVHQTISKHPWDFDFMFSSPTLGEFS